MNKGPQVHTPAFKAQVALAALKGDRTLSEIAGYEDKARDLAGTLVGFLLDPRRLTVAVSRAKRKMILVASRSVFSRFSPDEETFQNAMLWKNLLSRTWVNQLWMGSRDGIAVSVWGGS